MGSHLSLKRVKVLVAQSHLTLCDCSPPGSSVHGILQARILEWVAIPFSRRAERSYSTFKVRRGGCEEIPLVQGKEQWLRFA